MCIVQLNQMGIFCCILISCLLFEAHVSTHVTSDIFAALTFFDNRVPQAGVFTLTAKTVFSKVECAANCVRQNGCEGFFHHDVMQKCMTQTGDLDHNDVIGAGDVLSGTRYYRKSRPSIVTSSSMVDVTTSSSGFIFNTASPKYWPDAFAACDSDGGRLAVLDTQSKLDTVLGHARNNYNSITFHVGLTRPLDRWNTPWPNNVPDFQWITGQPVDMNMTDPYWNSNDPDNLADSENIVFLFKNIFQKMGDGRDRLAGYICEFLLV